MNRLIAKRASLIISIRDASWRRRRGLWMGRASGFTLIRSDGRSFCYERYTTDCCFLNCRWRAQSDIAGRVSCFIIFTFIFRNCLFYSKMAAESFLCTYIYLYILKNTFWNACGWFASLCSLEQWRNRLCVSHYSVYWLSFLYSAVFYTMKLIHIWTIC